jgi:tRNA threonylcarbamoyladenosine biosynthesis protein TsaE
MIEWPERGEGLLPTADLSIHIEYSGSGRLVRMQAATAAGEQLLTGLEET